MVFKANISTMDQMPSAFPSSASGQDNYPPQEAQGASQDNEKRTDGKETINENKDTKDNFEGKDHSSIDPETEQRNPDRAYFNAMNQGPMQIPQIPGSSVNKLSPHPQSQHHPPWPHPYAPPYTAAMQMERNAVSRNAFVDAPPLPSNLYSSGSPSRPGMRPNLQEVGSGGVDASGASTSPHGQNSPMPPRDFYFQQQSQQPPYRGNFGNYPYPPMPYGYPEYMQHPDHHGPPGYPRMYHNPYFRQDPSFGPFPPQMPYSRDREHPHWSPPMEGDSFSHNVAHHPQHSSSHGSAESFRFIRQINNNDVLCGRGGATNSHIGNRSFRQLVKEYKDKYLNAKKKEKPNVAGEIVDKIRSLDPPGRFLKKDRDTGYWLDIGDNRAKEKTSQALREGAPLIRKKMEEEKLLGIASVNNDEGGTANETASPEKTGTDTVEDAADDEGKRKMLSKMLLRNEEPSTDKDEKSQPPAPKRQKSEDTAKIASIKDDDNASKKSEDLASSKEDNDDVKDAGTKKSAVGIKEV